MAKQKQQNEYNDYRKDQLQEMKAKTSVKYHYIKRNTEVQFLRPRKKCNKNRETFAGQGLETKLENCRKELDSYKD